MRSVRISLLVLLAVTVGLVGCNQSSREMSSDEAAALGSNEAPPQQGMPASSELPAGMVAETMDTGGYTYVLIDTGSDKVWAAAPEFDVKVGDKVMVSSGMPMKDYHSSTLERTFDVVYFSEHIAVGDGGAAAAGGGDSSLPPGHPEIHPTAEVSEVDVESIEKAAGGYTVAELFADKAGIVGKEIAIRGQVVKFTPQIMGKNWIHIQDGTGGSGTNDLTVTTSATAKIGDVVLVKGKVAVDKDFGAGYSYAVIVEDASIEVQ